MTEMDLPQSSRTLKDKYITNFLSGKEVDEKWLLWLVTNDH